MAIRLKNKSYQSNLTISIATTFLLFVILFFVYLQQRESGHQVEILHQRMQTYSYKMQQELGDSLLNDSLFRDYVARNDIEGLRVTVIDTAGRVLMDSYSRNVADMTNHANRSEVSNAVRYGTGYAIKRSSEVNNEQYFYSATHVKPYIIRTALPYTAEIAKSLQADFSYLWYVMPVVFLLAFVLYRYTTRIKRHIGYLREFAVKAEHGDALDHELERRLPDDELGDISHTIITLYYKLQHSEADKARIKRQLTQNAAHELKTPAASIHGYLETIMDNPDMDELTRQRFLERCYAQSERMTKLLQDMMVLTKLDDMEQQPNSAPKKDSWECIDIVTVMKRVIDDVQPELTEAGINITHNVSHPLMLRADQSLVYSIFRNIIDNSIAYSGATAINITARETDETAKSTKTFEFIVADNGSGVAPQHLNRLFERFYRVDKGRSRKMGGTGLGMAIVKNAVTAHGGVCSAELTPGGGLTIRFTLCG